MFWTAIPAWGYVACDVGYLDASFVEWFIVVAVCQTVAAIWWLLVFKRRVYGRVVPYEGLTGIGI